MLINCRPLSDWVGEAVDALALTIAAIGRTVQVVLTMPHKLVDQLVEYWFLVLIWQLSSNNIVNAVKRDLREELRALDRELYTNLYTNLLDRGLLSRPGGHEAAPASGTRRP